MVSRSKSKKKTVYDASTLTPALRSSWLSRIQTTQASNVTPEMRAKIAKKAMRIQTMSRSAARSKKLQKASRVTKSALSRGMQMVASSSSASEMMAASTAVQQQWSSVSAAVDQDRIADIAMRTADFSSNSAYRSPAAAAFSFGGGGGAAASPPPPALSAPAAVSWRRASADEEEDDAYDTLALELGDAAPSFAFGAVAPAAGAAAAGAPPAAAADDGNAAMMAMLKKEPTDDTETAAKFGLFEKYLETVTNCRQTTLEFWADCRADFVNAEEDDEEDAAGAPAAPPAAPPAFGFGGGGGAPRRPVAGGAAGQIDAQLKRLDRPGAMGIDFDALAGRWYVHDMALKASKNNDALEQMLDVMRNKLELLSAQLECPVCLEPFKLEEEEEGEAEEEEEEEEEVGEEAEVDEEDGPRPALVLSCCHKVCDICWANWTAACSDKGRTPFCPLCNQEEFLSSILPDAVAP